jgi:hypothetical protein
MHAGTPFAKKGGAELSLPNMDIPISLLNWEVFLPEQYKVKDFGGDVIAANLVPTAFREGRVVAQESVYPVPMVNNPVAVLPGQMGGYVTDPSGAVIPNARVTVTQSSNGATRTTVSDSAGRWVVSGLDSGNYKIQTEVAGFQTTVLNVNYDANQPATYNCRLNLGGAMETVEVTAEAPVLNTESAMIGTVTKSGKNSFHADAQLQTQAQNQASANVLNLQKRVAGVLPVPVDVPRAGTSFSFVRPLVLDEETKVTFSYRSR